MTEYRGTALTREMTFALEGYLYARNMWKEKATEFAQQLAATGRDVSMFDVSDEKSLYRLAQQFVGKDYLGDLPGIGGLAEAAHRARRYLTNFNRVTTALKDLSLNLEDVAKGVGSGDSPE